MLACCEVPSACTMRIGWIYVERTFYIGDRWCGHIMCRYLTIVSVFRSAAFAATVPWAEGAPSGSARRGCAVEHVNWIPWKRDRWLCLMPALTLLASGRYGDDSMRTHPIGTCLDRDERRRERCMRQSFIGNDMIFPKEE